MSDQDPSDASGSFEEALNEARDSQYILRLYISGNTPTSSRAIVNLRKICEEHLEGHYKLEVIDIQQQPSFARDDQIIATPTLVKRLPLPIRKIIGDLSQVEKVLVGLNLSETKK